MNIWVIFGIITLNTLVLLTHCDSEEDKFSNSSSSDEESPTNLINITSAKLHYLNKDYINTKTYKVGLHIKNSTDTEELPLQWDVVKDFPKDTMLITRLVRSKSANGPWEDVQTYVSKICDLNDKYHDYLPPFLIELTKKGKCVKKGKYHFDDAGQFQFDRILEARSLKGWYFNTYNKIGASNPVVLIIDIEFQAKSVDVK